MISQPRYSVEVRDEYGRLVTTLLRPKNKQFNMYRNKPGSCQFTLDLLDPQATSNNLKVNQYDIIFRRNGTIVYAGKLSYLGPSVDGDDKHVDVIATGYFDLLDYRYITPSYNNYDAIHDQVTYTSIDASIIAWSLIYDSQFPLDYDGDINMQGATPTLCQSFVSPGTSTVKDIKLLMNVSGSPTAEFHKI